MLSNETPPILILKNIPLMIRKDILHKFLTENDTSKTHYFKQFKLIKDTSLSLKLIIEFNSHINLTETYISLKNKMLFHRKLQVFKYYDKKYKNKLFVFNLPIIDSETEREKMLEELENLFKNQGDCEIIRTTKNYMFVNFIRKIDSDKAIENLNDICFHKCVIQVRYTHKFNNLSDNNVTDKPL